MSELPSRVIFLNRTSSSGKTTLARAIQDFVTKREERDFIVSLSGVTAT